MQPKKLIAIYDENKAPIGYSEVREFTEKADLDAFIKTCDINKKTMLERIKQEKADLERKRQEIIHLNEYILKLTAYLVYERLIDTGDLPAEPLEEHLLETILKGGTEFPKNYILIYEHIRGLK